MSKGQIYGLYENGELVYKGTTHEIAYYFGGTFNKHLNEYAKTGSKLLWRYTVKIEEMPKKEIVPKKPNYEYQYVLDNIRLFGNSIVAKKNRLDEVIEFLKSNGYDVTARHVPKTKYEREFWVLEVKKDDEN